MLIGSRQKLGNIPVPPALEINSTYYSNKSVLRYWITRSPEGKGDTPYNGLYGDAPPEKGTFSTLQV